MKDFLEIINKKLDRCTTDLLFGTFIVFNFPIFILTSISTYLIVLIPVQIVLFTIMRIMYKKGKFVRKPKSRWEIRDKKIKKILRKL